MLKRPRGIRRSELEMGLAANTKSDISGASRKKKKKFETTQNTLSVE
jgi:hypothetical protein